MADEARCAVVVEAVACRLCTVGVRAGIFWPAAPTIGCGPAIRGHTRAFRRDFFVYPYYETRVLRLYVADTRCRVDIGTARAIFFAIASPAALDRCSGDRARDTSRGRCR